MSLDPSRARRPRGVASEPFIADNSSKRPSALSQIVSRWLEPLGLPREPLPRLITGQTVIDIALKAAKLSIPENHGSISFSASCSSANWRGSGPIRVSCARRRPHFFWFFYAKGQ